MRQEKTLGADARGAVVLAALFMAVVLVGLLKYMMGVGNAIVTHETMQDGADATAYAAAVYDARGMNVIAMVNLIMASVLSVLVALKITQALLVAANVISCLLAETGVGAVVCDATFDLEPRVQDIIGNVSSKIPDVLKALSVGEKGVAVAMPFLAEARSATVSGDYGPTMGLGLTASVSMVPAALIDFQLGRGAKALGSKLAGGETAASNEVKTATATEPEEHYLVCKDGFTSGADSSCRAEADSKRGCCSQHGGIDYSQLGPVVPPDKRIPSKPSTDESTAEAEPKPEPSTEQPSSTKGGKGSSSGAFGATGGRLGLPVQPDTFPILCKAAGKVVADLVLLPISAFGGGMSVNAFKQVAGNLIGNIVSTVPAYFCGGNGSDDVALTSLICGEAKSQATQAAASAAPASSSTASDAPAAAPGASPAPTGSGSSSSGAKAPAYNAKTCGAQAASGITSGKVSSTTSAKASASATAATDAAEKGAGEAGAAAEKESSSVLKDAHNESPLKVYDPAEFGSDYYAIWSFARESAPPKNQSSPAAGWFVAEAEFYYDLGSGEFSFGGDNKDPTKQTFPEDAMWNMRWRARLRRVQMPVPSVASILTSFLSDKLQDSLKDAISEAKPTRGDVGDVAQSGILDALFNQYAAKPANDAAKAVDEHLIDTAQHAGIDLKNNTFGLVH